MKHTYKISGMTCGSCKASVEKSLNDLDDVTNVVVNLEKEEAIITMRNHIEVETLQKTLSILKLKNHHHTNFVFKPFHI